MIKVLIIGSGGREHVIGWKIAQDLKKEKESFRLYFSPGNGGTSKIGTNIKASSHEEIIHFAQKEKIDLTIVGPEKDLVEGIVDRFQSVGLPIFGSDQASSQLEGSKAFAKKFMNRNGVKTAKSKIFLYPFDAIEYAKTQPHPLVVKASGLAQGKGVIICKDEFESEKAIRDLMISKSFGKAGDQVVIEDFLDGFEASILSVFNGKEIIPFISAKDHKKIGEGEKGLNTGGMGVVAPNPLFSEVHQTKFLQNILEPTLSGLLKENLSFAGVIFFGLMIVNDEVYLLEYNLRFGDPETQAVLPLLESNLYDIFQKSIHQESFSLQWKSKSSCCVVMVSGGYPLNYEKGFEIKGLDQVSELLFIAGAENHGEKLYTSGGRILSVVGLGNSLEKSRNITYENIKRIHFDFGYYRNDIGKV